VAEEYQLSGESGKIWFVGVLMAIPISVVLALVYAYVDVYNPLIYFTFVVWMFYLGAIMTTLKVVAKVSKCRNKKAIMIFGSLIGLLSIHISWACFNYVLLNKVFDNSIEIILIDLILSPSRSLKSASIIAESGWFTVFGYTPTGFVLWMIWIVEGLGILLAGVMGGLSVLHEEVFCEKCGSWADDIDYNVRLSYNEDTIEGLIKGDIDSFYNHSLAPDGESPHLRLNIHYCRKCTGTITLDFDLITLKRNDKGEIEEESEDISPVFIITEEQYERFQKKDFANSEAES